MDAIKIFQSNIVFANNRVVYELRAYYLANDLKIEHHKDNRTRTVSSILSKSKINKKYKTT